MGKIIKMAGFSRVFLLALIATGALGQRAGKNLRGTFPFSQNRGGNARGAAPQHIDHGHHGHHEDHHAHHAQAGFDDIRDARQRGRGGGDEVALDIGSIAAAGERCIDKVVMVEETEYDDVVACKHSYSEKCHTTYTTDFEPQQEEDCEENFVKSCFIEYRKVASEDTVTFCHTPIEIQGDGPETCETVYESQCETRYQEHDVSDDVVECEKDTKNVKKYSPETECKKVPREVCGPGTTQVPGQEECFDRKETVIQEVPEETCNLEPQRQCKHVTKLVPLLKPVEECVDIPKEVCSRSRTNPRKVQKPVVKKWCYVPTAQSGLA